MGRHPLAAVLISVIVASVPGRARALGEELDPFESLQTSEGLFVAEPTVGELATCPFAQVQALWTVSWNHADGTCRVRGSLAHLRFHGGCRHRECAAVSAGVLDVTGSAPPRFGPYQVCSFSVGAGDVTMHFSASVDASQHLQVTMHPLAEGIEGARATATGGLCLFRTPSPALAGQGPAQGERRGSPLPRDTCPLWLGLGRADPVLLAARALTQRAPSPPQP